MHFANAVWMLSILMEWNNTGSGLIEESISVMLMLVLMGKKMDGGKESSIKSI